MTVIMTVMMNKKSRASAELERAPISRCQTRSFFLFSERARGRPKRVERLVTRVTRKGRDGGLNTPGAKKVMINGKM